jgi:uncharacterized protein YndB with AHSA1/START domain
MVRQNSRARPQTLERQPADHLPALASVAREVSHGRTTVVMTWDFAAGRDAVWAMLTDPARLATWAPYTADRNLAHVGRATLRMIGDDENPDVELSSVVLVADPPQLLEHSWGADMLAWQLTVVGASSRLTLHQTLADALMASAIAAGWHLCLGVAASALAGHPVVPVRGMTAMQHGWADLNARYAVALGVPASAIAAS